LKPINVKTDPIPFKGHQAVRVTDTAPAGTGDEGRLAILRDTEFQSGTIEVDLAGEVGPGAAGGARGFVGIAFRVAPDGSRFECIYLRPTNGRADDQVRRNHSVQYISVPGFPWPRLRREFPDQYETYVDLAPGEWTKVKIDVQATRRACTSMTPRSRRYSSMTSSRDRAKGRSRCGSGQERSRTSRTCESRGSLVPPPGFREGASAPLSPPQQLLIYRT
jgi:hypothetical protein